MTRNLIWNISLAILWMCLNAKFALADFLQGFGLGLIILGVCRSLSAESSYFYSLLNCVKLFGLFLFGMIQANIELARDIIRPLDNFDHAVIGIDVSALAEFDKLILGYIISLTPGTLVLDAVGSNKTLYIHSLYGSKLESTKLQIERFLHILSEIHPVKRSEGKL